jgi:hypothetical protein
MQYALERRISGTGMTTESAALRMFDELHAIYPFSRCVGMRAAQRAKPTANIDIALDVFIRISRSVGPGAAERLAIVQLRHGNPLRVIHIGARHRGLCRGHHAFVVMRLIATVA